MAVGEHKFVTIPRKNLDYEKLNQNMANTINPQGAMYEKILPLLMQAKFEGELKAKRVQDTFKMLSEGGNGPGGDFKYAINANGDVTYSQKSDLERYQDKVARGYLGENNAQGTKNAVPNVVSNTTNQQPQVSGAPQGGDSLVPQGVPPLTQGIDVSAPPNLPPDLQAKFDADVKKKQIEAQISAIKTTGDRQQKLQEESDFTVRNLSGRANVVVEGWLDYLERGQQLTGAKAGPIQAILNTPFDLLRVNQFKEAFDGMNPEYSAAVAKASIPNVRALRMVDVFSKGKPNKWSSVMSGINNAGASQKMALAGYLAKHPENVTRKDGTPIIWKTNKAKWNKRNMELLNAFEKNYNDGWLLQFYRRNPQLLYPKDRSYVEKLIEGELSARGGK